METNGFVKISSSTDKHNSHIDIYEKRIQAPIQLVSPTVDYEDEYLDFYNDWKVSRENIETVE